LTKATISCSIVPLNPRWAVTVNPIAPCVNMYRDALFNQIWPDWPTWGLCLLVIAAVWAVSLPLFRRTTRYLADVY
jgi:ABC-type polysaccharide/polyol phosphate export permease